MIEMCSLTKDIYKKFKEGNFENVNLAIAKNNFLANEVYKKILKWFLLEEKLYYYTYLSLYGDYYEKYKPSDMYTSLLICWTYFPNVYNLMFYYLKEEFHQNSDPENLNQMHISLKSWLGSPDDMMKTEDVYNMFSENKDYSTRKVDLQKLFDGLLDINNLPPKENDTFFEMVHKALFDDAFEEISRKSEDGCQRSISEFENEAEQTGSICLYAFVLFLLKKNMGSQYFHQLAVGVLEGYLKFPGTYHATPPYQNRGCEELIRYHRQIQESEI